MPDDRELLETPGSGTTAGQPPAGDGGDRRGHPRDAVEPPSTSTMSPEKKPFGFLFWFALAFVGIVLLSAVLANVLPLQNPNFQNYTALNQGPSSAHLLGTDDLGRDLLSRLVFGARVSLIVGFFGVAIGLIFGGSAGSSPATGAGASTSPSTPSPSSSWRFPAIVAVIAIVTFWGASLFHITIILGIATIPLMYRVIRASSLSFAQRDFVVAAKTMGATDTRIVLREILPNVIPVTVTFSLITMAGLIVIEGTLGLPRPVGGPAHPVVGQPDQRGHRQQRPQHQPLDHAVAGAGHVPPPVVDQPDRRPPPPALRHPRGRSCDGPAHGQVAALQFRDAGTHGGPLLVVEDLHTSFRTPRGTVRAVDGVSFEVHEGKTLGIVGESGSGKTVLSRSIMGLLPPRDVIRSGTVHFAGHELTAMDDTELRQVWGAELSMIFQDPMTALNPVKRIGDQISESLILHLDMDKKEAGVDGGRAAAVGRDPLARAAGASGTRSSCRAACASGS